MESFELAKEEQIDAVSGLYESCKRRLLEDKIFQWGEWGNGYPNREFAENSVRAGDMYALLSDGKLVGSVVLNEKQSREWEHINWTKVDGKVLAIHALVINPADQGKGRGKKLLTFCEEYAKTKGYACVRLDAFTKNETSNRLYVKYGYKNVGTTLFESKPEGNKEYFCYEKMIWKAG